VGSVIKVAKAVYSIEKYVFYNTFPESPAPFLYITSALFSFLFIFLQMKSTTVLYRYNDISRKNGFYTLNIRHAAITGAIYTLVSTYATKWHLCLCFLYSYVEFYLGKDPYRNGTYVLGRIIRAHIGSKIAKSVWKSTRLNEYLRLPVARLLFESRRVCLVAWDRYFTESYLKTTTFQIFRPVY